MYNDTIKAENKIISNDDLAKIFLAMGETLKKYQKISEAEKQRNHMLDYAYQNYSFKDQGSKMKVTVDFYDNTDITFDNYDTFASVFYSRLDEIKRMDVYYSLTYDVITPEPNRSTNYYSQHIQMSISENKLDISLKLDSKDRKLDDIYNLIKNVILEAPEKYDMVIKKKSLITNIISLSIGMIPSLILTSLLLFVPGLNNIFFKGYIVYPIFSILIAYIIGNIIASAKLEKYYNAIMPDKKYAGYSDGHSIYKDDIDSFVGTSEILIGKKVSNLFNREQIKREYEKYKKLLPKEFLALGVISIIVIIISLFI